MSSPILISGGAGYLGSHAAYTLKNEGFEPVVLDNLSTGNAWATSFGAFEQGDIADVDFVRSVCDKYAPLAVIHFASLSEPLPSDDPTCFFADQREKASIFFKTINACGIKRVVLSSTADVYGDLSAVYGATGAIGPVSEVYPAKPGSPYALSMLETEAYARMLDVDGFRSITLRFFNAAGAAPVEAQIGEAHAPENHLIPRLLLPLLNTPDNLLNALGIKKTFVIHGDDFPTPDGTALRDFVHVLDLADAHRLALTYLLKGGRTDVFNLGSNTGFSLLDIVNAARKALNRPNFTPKFAPRDEDDQPKLVAGRSKAEKILGWRPERSLVSMIADAAAWYRSPFYLEALYAKTGQSPSA
ncbi:MAG: NAD-dependent epimerase/dehydratase family protein [Alphaproteobacteria bacterium]|nr:NAD-dependent epimerase/dehydratase family protein [Alphaproteobacteria bacterium]